MDIGLDGLVTAVLAYVLGLLTNFTSRYVNPRLDRQLGTMSSWWRRRRDDRRDRREAWIRELAADDHWQLLTALKAQRLLTSAVLVGGFAFTVFFVSAFFRFEPLPGRERFAEFVIPVLSWGTRLLIGGALLSAFFLMRGAAELEEIVDRASRVPASAGDNSSPAPPA